MKLIVIDPIKCQLELNTHNHMVYTILACNLMHMNEYI